MKLFGKGDAERKKMQSQEKSTGCAHPLTHQVSLREDPSDPRKVTGMKCSQCGERILAQRIAS